MLTWIKRPRSPSLFAKKGDITARISKGRSDPFRWTVWSGNGWLKTGIANTQDEAAQACEQAEQEWNGTLSACRLALMSLESLKGEAASARKHVMEEIDALKKALQNRASY